MNSSQQSFFQEKQKPILLAYLKNFPLSERLLSLLLKELRVVWVSNNSTLKSKNVWHIREDISKLQKDRIQINYLLLYIDGKSNKKFVKEILDAVRSSNLKVILLINIREWQNFREYIHKVTGMPNSKVLFLGDIFGQNLTIPSSPISQILKNISVSKRIYIRDNELFPIFPISDHDALSSLTAMILTHDDKSKMKYFFYQHPLTYISAIHLLKRIEPDLQVVFKDKKRRVNTLKLFQHFDDEIKKHFNFPVEFLHANIAGFEKSVQFLIDKKDINFSIFNIQKYRDLKLQKLKKRTMLFIGATFGTVLLYFLSSYILFFSSLVILKQSITALDRNELNKAHNLSTLSHNIFSFTDFPIKLTLPILPGEKENNEDHYSFIKQSAYLTSVLSKSLLKFQESANVKNAKTPTQELTDLQYVYLETLKIKTDNPTADQKVISILLKKPKELLYK